MSDVSPMVESPREGGCEGNATSPVTLVGNLEQESECVVFGASCVFESPRERDLEGKAAL